MTERHAFIIPIGDWSGDGHGHCETFPASATKPIEAVREAFFSAKAKHPLVSPDVFCHRYEDPSVPEAVQAEVKRLGGPDLPGKLTDADDPLRLMAETIVWFLNLGDPELDVQLSLEPETPRVLRLRREEAAHQLPWVRPVRLASMDQRPPWVVEDLMDDISKEMRGIAKKLAVVHDGTDLEVLCWEAASYIKRLEVVAKETARRIEAGDDLGPQVSQALRNLGVNYEDD